MVNSKLFKCLLALLLININIILFLFLSVQIKMCASKIAWYCTLVGMSLWYRFKIHLLKY